MPVVSHKSSLGRLLVALDGKPLEGSHFKKSGLPSLDSGQGGAGFRCNYDCVPKFRV